MIPWRRLDTWIERWLARRLERLEAGDVARCIRGDLHEEIGARRPGPRRTFALLMAAADLGLRYRSAPRVGAASLERPSSAAGRRTPGRRRGILASSRLDFHSALRSLLKGPGFTCGVVLTLSLGIGATATIYSVVDGVLLRPLPYDDPAALVVVVGAGRDAAGISDLGLLPMDAFLGLRERARSFHGLAAIERTNVFLKDVGRGPDEMPAARVSGEFFDILGVTPALGRAFLPEDHLPAADGVLLLSYSTWKNRYGADPGVIGRAAERLHSPAIVVGVLPEDFQPPEAVFAAADAPEVWLPLQPAHRRYARSRPVVSVLGRLAPGSTPELAAVEVAALGSELSSERTDGAEIDFHVAGLHSQTVGSSSGVLRVFLAAAALLLLLAAMNAASLFLARLFDRTEELRTRSALGARRIQLVRLLLCEAALVTIASGALGVLLARAGVAGFVAYAPDSIPRFDSIAIDGRVLAATVVLSLGAGLGAAVFPALRILSRGSRRSFELAAATPGPRSRSRSVLVGGQVAAAVVLLTGAALLFHSFLRLRAVDPGFDPDGLLTARVGLEGGMRSAEGGIASVAQAWDVALAEVGSIPGVEAVAGASSLPFQAPSWSPRILLPGDRPDTWREGIAGYVVTPSYFETLGAKVLRGRGLDLHDREGGERVAVVNESFVRTQLDAADPLGMVLKSSESGVETDIRVVGLVGDIVQARTEDGPRPAIYVPYTQRNAILRAVVRTAREPATLTADLRRAVARFNPIEPPREILTMRARMGGTRTTPRFQAALMTAFAAVALLLAATGLASSLAHSVARRQRELGVRMALGAGRRAVLSMILREGMRVSALGLGVGLAAAVGLARFLEGVLYGVRAYDPITLLLVGAVLLAVSLAACLLPARRATSVDPVRVLGGS